jgi:hypothetical protein
MSLQETRAFLEELLLRFDPNLDVSDGSRASAELIDPILNRVGPDPFDEDIVTFIRTRIQQMHPELAITEADELTNLVLQPMQVLIEPLTREVKLVKLRSSLRNIDSLSDDEVDALMGNFFEGRQAGGYATGTVRAYFANPQTVSITLVHIASAKSGLRFLPTRPQQITADQMLLNVEGSEYYVDFNYVAESRGDEYNVEIGEIANIANLPTASRVKNLRRFANGVARESNTEFAARVQQSTSDRTLVTRPGIVGVLGQNFPELRRVFDVGFGEAEMERDIIQGGGLGPIPANDVYGAFYGTGAPVDDLDADATSAILEASGGNFVSRLGAVNSVPDGWYVSMSYVDPTSSDLIMVDAEVLEVVSNTQVLTDHEMPLTLTAASVRWALRRKEITISDIPGGIVLPDSTDGSLAIRSDEVHIGGKTDVYVVGAVEDSSTQITGLSDASPIARGLDAQTAASDLVTLVDIDGDLEELVEAGMSLVLSEGVDAGSYRILEVLDTPFRVRLDLEMTGTQSNLTWKVVDEIDVDLITPKDILCEGDDAIAAAGSALITTSSGFNFIDAGVRPDDVLFLDDDNGGDFVIQEVTVSTLTVSPTPTRALPGVSYEVSRRSPGVLAPVVHIESLDLLDSAGAPNGTSIPYRDPVLVRSNGFQNEGSGYIYDGAALSGLITSGFASTLATSGLTITWAIYDPDQGWDAPAATGTFTFAVTGVQTAAQIAAQITAHGAFVTQGTRATALSYGGLNYVGISSPYRFKITGGTALSLLGLTSGWTNCMVRGVSSASLFDTLKVRSGDVLEYVDGNNAGTMTRVIEEPSDAGGVLLVGMGSVGPSGTSALFASTTLNPEAGGRVRIGRPSVGSARVYFLDPTSAEFGADTRFTIEVNGQELVYRPDPENTRTVIPAPPLTTLPATGEVNDSTDELTDTEANFLLLGIRPGDLLDILYVPITGTAPLSAVGNIAVTGLTLILRFDEDPYLTVSFPYAMPRDDVASYINTQLGVDIATIEAGGALELQSSRRLEISLSSTALATLSISDTTNEHPAAGTYIIGAVSSATVLTLADATPFSTSVGTTADTQYRIRRHVQRISSTEMNLNLDASGLYYVDVEAISLAPGDRNNIGSGYDLEVTGHYADGYRLVSANTTTTYSRAEELSAEISRTILLVGSSDSPEEYVQLSGQNVQVSYRRSTAVDEVQSFCNSTFRRVLCSDILVRHLLPNYISMNWAYAGGSTEPVMKRAIQDYLDTLESEDELEVNDLTNLLRQRQATSVYTPDTASSTGRRAPLILVVQHGVDRKIRAVLVDDVIATLRTQYYDSGTVVLRRLSSSGVR